MSVIDRLRGVTLESFLEEHPEVPALMAKYPAALPAKVEDPLLLLAAESAYNENAMSFVCTLGGIIGEQSSYRHRYLVQSQVMAAFSVEEGGFAERGFLDPHSSLRLFMLDTASRIVGRVLPEVPFARLACKRMGDAYLWRNDSPEVAEPHAAMLGAHFASEYLAAKQEFPGLVNLFERDQPELFNALRSETDSQMGFTASAWLEGHPKVELQHARYAARAAVAATTEHPNPDRFWKSWRTGFEQFCKNDARYFAELAAA